MTDAPLYPPVTDTAIEVDGVLSPSEIRVCPGCGRFEPQWRENEGKGYLSDDDHTYCCRGCADETGCTCT